MKKTGILLLGFLVFGFSFVNLFSQNIECQPIVIDENNFFSEDFSDYDSVALAPLTNSAGVIPDCWKPLTFGAPGPFYSRIVKGSYNSFTLHSSCLQLRCNPVNASRRVVYAVLPEISTDLNTLEVGFSMASTVCDSSIRLSLGFVTDTVFETVDFVAVDSFRNNDLLVDSFVRHEVSLEGIVFPENARLAFRLKNIYNIQTSMKAVFIDDIVIRPIPACRKPVDMELVSISDTFASLRWQMVEDNASCRVEYGPAGFVQGTGTTLVTSSHSTSLHPLTESTEYDVYIQTICSETNTSEPAHFHFKADCPSIMVDEQHPYAEDFSDADFACWRQLDGYYNGWQADSGRLFSPNRGNGRSRRLQSPVFDLSSVPTARCVFSYNLSSSSSSMERNLCLYYRTSVTEPWVLLKTYTESSAIDTVILPYLSENYQISFVAEKRNNEVNLFNVSIEASSECLAPPRPRVLEANSAAHVAWVTYYQGAAVELEYGLAGFAIGTGERVSAAAAEHDRWLSGLLPNTAYDVYVRQECAGGVWSAWSEPLTFHTYCSNLTLSDSVIFTENFEGLQPGDFPECWLRFSEGTDESHFPHVYQGEYTPSDVSKALLLTGTHLSSELQTVGSQCVVALPYFSNPLAELELTFTTSMTSTQRVTLEVGYLDANEDFVSFAEVPVNHYFSQDRGVVHLLRLRDFDISDSLRARIAFRWQVDTVRRCYACLDDIRVRPVLACDYPLNVRVQEVTDQTCVVRWQPRDSTQNLWELEYSGTTLTLDTDTCALGDLAPDADYFVIIRSLCGESHSFWTDTVFFHTACKYFHVLPYVFYSDDFTDYESTYNVYDMADQPDCWSFIYNGYYPGFAPHIYNGSYSLNNPALLLSVGVEGGTIGRELFAIMPPFFNDLEELRLDFDLNISRDMAHSLMVFGYLTDRYDPATFHLIDTVEPHFYTDSLNAHRCYFLREYAPLPNKAHLAFKLNSTDQTTHFYSIDNVTVRLATDTIDDHIGDVNGSFTLYPNPTSGIVTIQLSPETCTLNPEIQVFDVFGRRLGAVGANNHSPLRGTPIDLSHYSPGVYFIKLVNDGKVIGVRKVVRR
jgi:hypothetical protein